LFPPRTDARPIRESIAQGAVLQEPVDPTLQISGLVKSKIASCAWPGTPCRGFVRVGNCCRPPVPHGPEPSRLAASAGRS